MNPRAYRHYPYFLLSYGKSIWQLYQAQHGNSSYKERSWASTSQLQSKIEDVALEAESAVIAASNLSIYRKVFLLKSKHERPRKEVVAVMSLILLADLIELPPSTTIKRTARIIGEAIDSDDVAGSMVARCGIADLIMAESLCLVNDELHTGSTFASFLSGNKAMELNSTLKQIQEFVAASKTKAKTQKEQIDEAVRAEAKKLKEEGSPILDALKKRNVE